MGKVSLFVLVVMAFITALTGCQRKDEAAVTSNASQSQTTANPEPSSRTAGDPSLPDASTALAADDTPDKPKTTQDTDTLQHTPTPQKEMTKEEESNAMPLPGQANDHSTTALDKTKGK